MPDSPFPLLSEEQLDSLARVCSREMLPAIAMARRYLRLLNSNEVNFEKIKDVVAKIIDLQKNYNPPNYEDWDNIKEELLDAIGDIQL